MARAALKDIQIFNPYVNQNGSFNAYSYYDHGVESQENLRNAFPVTDQCERSAQLMGDDYVRLKFNLTAYVPMAAFSFIRYDGQTFFLMNDYCPHSNGSRMEHDQQGNEMVVSDSYEYDMKFYSVANMLRKPICYRHVKVAKGATAADGYHEWDEPEVTVSATLETMYVIIVQSIEQYTSRLDSDFLLTRMLATIPTNGLDNTGIAPKNTVKLTAGTELATFNFNGEKIADVCTAVANTYSDAKKETEWYIEEDAEHSLTLHFCKCVDTGSMNHADDFSYKKTEGVDRYTKPIKTGGLKKVDYSRDESNIPQVIIPFGSERNMTYQAVKGIDEVSQMQSTFGKRLRLKTNHTCTIDGTQYPTAAMQAKGITGAYAVTDKDGNTVPLGVDAHGGIANDKVNTGVEKVEYFDDVYPQCHFQVSKVDVRNKKKDGATIPEYTCEGKVVNAQGQEIQPEGDFYPIQIEEGTTLSVRFESGYLNGREFEIANKTSKKADDGSMQTNYTLRFVIVADGSIEDGTLIPSGNFKPNVGDKFALFNMKMPEAYITYAQEELAQKAYEKLMEYQDTVPDVKCTSDPDSFSGKDVYFGAQYTINSEKLGFTLNAQNRRVPIDFISRVVAYSYKLTKVNDVSFTLSSALVRGVLSEMAAAITNVSYATDSLGQRSVNLSRRGYRDASEVADMITNVTTEMMLVGNEKYQFQYTSEILPLHTNGVFTGLKVSYGQLQHTQQPYIDYANGGMWQIEPNASLNEDYQGNALDGTKPYYVFALCGTDSLDWATVILMDKDAAEAAGVYRKDAEISDQDAYPEYLLLGILSSEFAEEKNGQMTYERVFSPTNGFTAIEGGTITTEQIQDANRQLIIDFQSYPPRIIARGGAEIIGNITFKSFKDENGTEVLDVMNEAIGDAKETADNALQKAENITNDGIISGGTEKQELNREFIIIAGANRNGTGSDGSYMKAIKQARTYGVDTTDLDDAFEDLLKVMKVVLGVNSSTGIIDGSNIQNDTYIGGKKNINGEDVATYDIKNIAYGNLYKDGTLVLGSYDSTISLVSGQKYLVSAKSKTGGSNNVSIGVITNAGTLHIGTLGDWVSSEFNISTEVTSILDGLFHLHAQNASSVTLTGLKLRKIADIDTVVFNALWKNYYDAEVALLNVVSDVIDAREVGGENLTSLTEDHTELVSSGTAINLGQKTGKIFPSPVPFPSGKYVFSADLIEVLDRNTSERINIDNCYILKSSAFSASNIVATIHNYKTGVVDCIEKVEKSFTLREESPLFLYIENQASNFADAHIVRCMLQHGEKKTEYQSNLKYLAEAFEHDARQLTTSIDGGLIVSALLKLINQDGDVTAGMSGLKGDNVLQWGGATYAEALYAAANNFIKAAGGTLINYLIKKDGTGKIGCFYIVDANTVEIENDGKTGKIRFSLTDGITVYKRASSSATYTGFVHFALDGSGYLAGGNITWDASGNFTANNGTFRGIMQASKFAYGVQVFNQDRTTDNSIRNDVSFVLNVPSSASSTVVARIIILPTSPVEGQAITIASYDLTAKVRVSQSVTHTIKAQNMSEGGVNLEGGSSGTFVFTNGVWYLVNNTD